MNYLDSVNQPLPPSQWQQQVLQGLKGDGGFSVFCLQDLVLAWESPGNLSDQSVCATKIIFKGQMTFKPHTPSQS